MTTLTQREFEILQRLAAGDSVAIIAADLSVTVATVRTHVQHLRYKTGQYSIAGVVGYAYRAALLTTQARSDA